ncbi:vesicle-associated membrane protein 3 isoform X1 [Magallana gigas]|uniref:vesicle-associated membrane protein 3 isoform X1 n=2 Tax=Magallana gigas TaxID=29159 RepID=UPI00333F99BB
MSAPPQNPVAGPGGPPMSAAGGPGGPQPAQPSKRLQQTQAQVDEVVDIMRVNVDKVLERDQKISELDDRADALQAGASQFEASAGKLKRKYWWKNCKFGLLQVNKAVETVPTTVDKSTTSLRASSIFLVLSSSLQGLSYFN